MYFIPFTAFKKDENGHTYGYNTHLQQQLLQRMVIYANTYMYNMFKRKIKPKNNGYVCYFFRVCECDTI